MDARPPVRASRAVKLRLTTSQRSLKIDEPELVSRALLTALALTRRDEEAVRQWQLLTALPPASVGSGVDRAESSPSSLADVLLGRRGRLDAEGRQALRAKRALPVWRVVGRIAARAATPAREQMLLRELVAALRLANAPGVHVLAKRRSASLVDRPGRSWLAPLRLNTSELATVAAWPIGLTGELSVERSGARLLPVSKEIARHGRIIGRSTFPGRERPVALAARDGLRHLHVLGPTGVGKSTLLLNLIVQDIAAGRGVVVIEPKGDLVEDVLARIPGERLDDVVLLDPADEARPVGLNPLAANGRPPEPGGRPAARSVPQHVRVVVGATD
jgi:hypothetical protein